MPPDFSPGMAMQKPIISLPSNAPNTCPPIFVATTKSRSGMRSTSSKPQIWRCNFTTVFRSSRSVSGRVSIIVRLGLLPERLHLIERRARQRRMLFDMSEALAKLRVGLAQRLFGIHFEQPRQVHQDEQQIADFALDFR